MPTKQVALWEAGGEHLTNVDMPHNLVDIVCSGTIAKFRGISADDIIPFLLFEVPNAAGKEAGGN